MARMTVDEFEQMTTAPENSDRRSVSQICRLLRGLILNFRTRPPLPDLAVEVQSPYQSAKLMRDKADYYLANGTKMV